MIMQKSKYIFSGECFRRFLIRNRLTYLAAAKLLDLDKNTVGKVARGGNTSIAVLLRIVNHFGIPVEKFFVECESMDGGKDCDCSDSHRDYIYERLWLPNDLCTEDLFDFSQLYNDKLLAMKLDRIISQLNRIEKCLREKTRLDDE